MGKGGGVFLFKVLLRQKTSSVKGPLVTKCYNFLTTNFFKIRNFHVLKPKTFNMTMSEILVQGILIKLNGNTNSPLTMYWPAHWYFF